MLNSNNLHPIPDNHDTNGFPEENADEFHELVVDGILDLHMFQPKSVKELIPDYLEECRERGILSVRIIHGKGTGTLRRMVHAILEKLPWVASYRLASEGEGGWGATVVELTPLGEKEHDGSINETR
ncbi:MAG TPA: Smr/MutS family protein [Desulfomonilia bacterium]|nr:Smr/MutS family protein [Desulfomonilia bacterium]